MFNSKEQREEWISRVVHEAINKAMAAVKRSLDEQWAEIRMQTCKKSGDGKLASSQPERVRKEMITEILEEKEEVLEEIEEREGNMHKNSKSVLNETLGLGEREDFSGLYGCAGLTVKSSELCGRRKTICDKGGCGSSGGPSAGPGGPDSLTRSGSGGELNKGGEMQGRRLGFVGVFQKIKERERKKLEDAESLVYWKKKPNSKDAESFVYWEKKPNSKDAFSMGKLVKQQQGDKFEGPRDLGTARKGGSIMGKVIKGSFGNAQNDDKAKGATQFNQVEHMLGPSFPKPIINFKPTIYPKIAQLQFSVYVFNISKIFQPIFLVHSSKPMFESTKFYSLTACFNFQDQFTTALLSEEVRILTKRNHCVAMLSEGAKSLTSEDLDRQWKPGTKNDSASSYKAKNSALNSINPSHLSYLLNPPNISFLSTSFSSQFLVSSSAFKPNSFPSVFKPYSEATHLSHYTSSMTTLHIGSLDCCETFHIVKPPTALLDQQLHQRQQWIHGISCECKEEQDAAHCCRNLAANYHPP